MSPEPNPQKKSPVHVIAEAGTNHGGSLETARQLVDIARLAGADSVKFQVIYPEGLYLPEFLVNGAYVPNEVYAKRQAAMLSDADWRRLAEHARATGLPMSASVFDARGLDLLDALDAPYIKIASCDLNNTPLLEAAAARGRRLLVSTGMSTIPEIAGAVAAIRRVSSVDLILMHCVSVYPCPLAQTNLAFIDTLQREFGLPVGFSDHTENSVAAAIAVSKGVTWIEKHCTFDRAAVGFDHAYAMEPAMLKAYIADLRATEAAIRPAAEKVQTAEASVRQRARRSLYAARDLAPGDTISPGDVLIVRPEGPLRPEDAARVVGTRTRRMIRRFEAITWEGIAA
jgi:N,N'-diacetyllegionaminate synthase